MKLRFEFSEDLRMKAYYLLQLKRRLDPRLSDHEPFDVWCCSVAEVAFRDYLDNRIDFYNDILERSVQNVTENDETPER